MGDQENKIALAGLLHDIGKLSQRAGESGSRAWDARTRRDFGYLHALLTADFIEKYLPDAWKGEIKRLAASHHQPKSTLEQALALADYLSAGERADPHDDQRAAQPRQLLSIFCALTADGVKAPQERYLPLAELTLDEKALFPGEAWEEERAWLAYEKLWQDFCVEVARLGQAYAVGENLAGYLESLLLLEQRYTWCIPSAYYHARPDISLYDHSRMTAALASILSSADAGTLSEERSGDELALLVCGDLSGLQEFLYTITSRGATSALRGRSFYLQLLGEALARFVLRQLDLPITNLIYSGGGNFYLLARPGDAEKLRQIRQQVSQVLYTHHHASLYLALASMPLHREDFFGGRISSAWERLGYSLQYAKQRRFEELGSRLAVVFAPQGHGGNEEQQCQVCGEEHPHILLDRQNGEDEGVRKCPACKSYEELGEDLRQAGYLILEQVDTPPLPAFTTAMSAGTWQEALACLGMKAVLTGEAQGLRPDESTDPLENKAGAYRLVLALSDKGLAALNGAQALPSNGAQALPSNGAQALRPYLDGRTAIGRRMLVNVTPRLSEEEFRQWQDEGMADLPSPGHTKPFDVLAAQSTGIPRLGVLRMDVDNLGALFARGLGQQAVLARVAALSFAVSLYFEGWVETLAQGLYSIYSGGDDLFFVGAWDGVVELARKIRLDFTRYAAGHPGLHASAGIVLASGKYPLAQAAQDAGRALEQAKHLKWVKDGKAYRKDAMSFLGQALPWEKFGLEEDCTQTGLGSAHALMHLLVDSLAPHTPVTPLVRRLIALHERYQETLAARRKAGTDQNRNNQDQVLWGRWMWLGYYSLQRLAEQAHSEEIKQLNEKIKQDQFRSIEWIGLAARWSELRLRKPSTKPS